LRLRRIGLFHATTKQKAERGYGAIILWALCSRAGVGRMRRKCWLVGSKVKLCRYSQQGELG